MERVQGKKGGHKGAAPAGPGQAFKREKKQHGIGGMEQQVREMMPARFGPEKLRVEHVREQG